MEEGRQYQEQLRNQGPIKVRCQCQWEGTQNELVEIQRSPTDRTLHCPVCHTKFQSWP